jgi:hypothetical protein
MKHQSTTVQTCSDLEFIQEIRECVARYLQAVDDWEAEYYRFYRLARPNQNVTPDLEDAQHAYISARRQLEGCIPRARRLCSKFDLRDPWPGLLRIELGAHPPQVRVASAFGRSERIAIADCLNRLLDCCASKEAQVARYVPEEEAPPLAEPRRNWVQRVLDYFI